MGINETGTITLKLLAQDLASGHVGKFIGNLDRLAKQGGLMGSVMQGVGQSFGQMLNPMMLATKGIGLAADAAGATFKGMQDLARAFEEDKVAAEQFSNTLARSLPDWKRHTAAMDDAILAGQRLGFSDDRQRASLGKLVTATRNASRAIDINRLAMNIARQRSVRLEEATDAVTKAAQGQTRIEFTPRGEERLVVVLPPTAGGAGR